jgi:hypothetical protein
MKTKGLKDKIGGLLTVIFVSSIITGLIFKKLELSDSNYVHLICGIFLPILGSCLVYNYYQKKNK